MTETEGSTGQAPAGKAAAPFEVLLQVQDRDTAIEQLVHRRATLPEREQLAQVESRLAELGARNAELVTERDRLAHDQAGLEEQIESTRSRRAGIESRMFGGQVTAARELQAMDEEVKHLGAHVTELEDRELEVMEVLEPLEAELSALGAEADGLQGTARSLREAITAGEAAIDAELDIERARRVELAVTVAKDLLARYEQLRSRLGGVGAARLVAGSCGGCHLALPSMELDRIHKAPPDALLTCDQCGRILVR